METTAELSEEALDDLRMGANLRRMIDLLKKVYNGHEGKAYTDMQLIKAEAILYHEAKKLGFLVERESKDRTEVYVSVTAEGQYFATMDW